MNVQERVRMCRLIEQMQKQAGYAHALGIENKSSFTESKKDTPAKKEGMLSH